MRKNIFFLIASMFLYASFMGIQAGERSLSSSFYYTMKREKFISNSDRMPYPLHHKRVDKLIDIRGYGDSSWSETHASSPLPAKFGEALDRFSKDGRYYRGDLNFINWESALGKGCAKRHAPYHRGKSYAFLSLAENIEQALIRGIDFFDNLFSRFC